MSTEIITDGESETVCIERKYIYKWNIKNFDCPQAVGSLPSTKFEFEFGNNLKFIGDLSLIGPSCGERMCKLVITNQTSFLAWQLNVTLLSSGKFGEIYVLNQHNNFIRKKVGSEFGYPERCCTLLHRNYTIICEITLVEYRTVSQTNPRLFPAQESNLRDDLVELFKSKKYYDVVILVEGHQLHAHKNILASRSKVFDAMFEHEMEEAKLNRITITDIRLEVFQELLRYIYTDEVLNINKVASELLAASDMYDLPTLKSMCANELYENISAENAAEILILADLHRSQNLKDQAIGFIKNNSKAVADTEGFKTIVSNYSQLFAEIYLNIIN